MLGLLVLQILREMISLGCPPSMEYCNDLLRVQGKRGHVEGLFHTLDVRTLLTYPLLSCCRWVTE